MDSRVRKTLHSREPKGIQYVPNSEAPSGSPPIAVRAGDLIFVGGQMAIHPMEGMPPEVKLLPGYTWHGYGTSIEKQLNYIYANLNKTLGKLGSSLQHTVNINSYHIDYREIYNAMRVRKEWFGADNLPPSTLVLAPELSVHGPTVLIDIINLAEDSPFPRSPVVITKAPNISHVAAFGWAGYLQAVWGGGLIFTAGKVAAGTQGPIPESLPDSEFPYRYNQIRLHTEYVLNTLKNNLSDAGCSLDQVVRAEIHLKNIEDLPILDEVWREFFPKDPPARVVVPLTLSESAYLVEIGFIAVDPEGPYHKEIVNTSEAPAPLGHESQAVKTGPYLFMSGLMATDYKQGVAPDARPDPNFPYYSSSVKRQVEYIYRNVEAICEAAGTSTRNLVKRRVYHLDLREMPIAEEVWQKRLGDRLPPTSFLRVDGPLPVPGCTIQYDLMAFAPE